jgi:hypothetical protein
MFVFAWRNFAMTTMEQVKDEVMVQLFCIPNHRMQPQEVERAVAEQLNVSMSMVKEALNELLEEGEVTFVHRDPFDYLEIAPALPHRAARPMKVVIDDHGDPWLCDGNVDRSGDLYDQGCWSCGDVAFTRND